MAIAGSNPLMAAQTIARRTCAVAMVAVAAVLSWADKPAGAQTDPRVGSGIDDRVNPYSKLSNEQLGTLAGTFDDLDRDQRRWFLTEVRKRMSAKGKGPRIEVDQDHRFGRRVVNKDRDADPGPGETRNPVGALRVGDERADATKVYGTGLESQGEETADVPTPALQSEDPSKPSE